MTETPEVAQGWVSLSEAAQTTGYAVSTLQRLVRLRKLVAHKKGQKWFIDQAALARYIESTAPGRKPAEPTALPSQGLTLWFPKIFSKSPLGLDALINGVQFHFAYLRLEYPQSPTEHLADLAPGLPGFYAISARASISAIQWLEKQFANGEMRIEILKRNFPVVHYSQPVDSVTETVTGRPAGYLSAAFGFYKAEVASNDESQGRTPDRTGASGQAAAAAPVRQTPLGEWLSLDEAMQRAGCDSDDLSQLLQTGKVVAMKRYGHWQVNANSLQSYLQEVSTR